MNKDSQLRGVVGWFLGNHVASNLLMLFILIVGLVSLLTINREIFPTIDPKIINVTVPYPGATPEDIEESITRRVDDAVVGLQGVKRVESNAVEGLGNVIIEIDDFADSDQVLNDVETAVNAIQDFPPENAEKLTINKLKPVANVMKMLVHGDHDLLYLRTVADQVKDQLKELPDVSLVELYGTSDREISIEVSDAALKKYNLSHQQLAEIIRANSLDIPLGNLKTNSNEIALRVKEKNYYGYQFSDIVIKTLANGSQVKLSDIAIIKDAFTDDAVSSTYNNQNAIGITVERDSSQDTLKITEQIKEFLAELKLPEGVTLTVWKDETSILADRINLLTRNAILGLALVFLSLVLFMDLKLAFWTAVGIAVSFLGGIAIAGALGVTINMISLFALIVVLGVVVDDAIIAGESIFAEQEAGKKDNQAVSDGVSKVLTPVTIGVLTTVGAFAPLTFSTGILGQILKPIPIIVIAILLLSLLEAFLILPSHLRSSTRWSRGYIKTLSDKVTALLNSFIDNYLIPLAKLCLKFKYYTVLIVLAFIVFSFLYLQLGLMKFVFFPNIEADELTVKLEMPVGSSMQQTEDYLAKILEVGRKVDRELSDKSLFESVAIQIGGHDNSQNGPHSAQSNTSASNLAQIDVKLVPSDERSIGAAGIERIWQQKLSNFTKAKKISLESSLVRDGADIDLQLAGRSNEELEQATEFLKTELTKLSHLYEVSDSSEPGKLEYQFILNEAGRSLGLTPQALAGQLRAAFYGIEIDRIQRGANEVKIMLKSDNDIRSSLNSVLNKEINVALAGQPPRYAKLSEVSDIVKERSLENIKRVDGRKIIQVTADIDSAYTSAGEKLAVIFSEIAPKLKEKFPTVSISIEGDSKRRANDLKVLLKNMFIALLVIFLMIASQLRSYAKPLIILLTVPIGLAGALNAHLLFGYNLSFVSLFGMVALTGVVINDSIVLVDYYNKLLARGVDEHEAILESLRRRFRPILLTTLTTSLGLLPMLFETSLQAKFIIPMAISLAGGIVFASAILIFFIPCCLEILNSWKRSVKEVVE